MTIDYPAKFNHDAKIDCVPRVACGMVSKKLHVFVKVITYICQSCYMSLIDCVPREAGGMATAMTQT